MRMRDKILKLINWKFEEYMNTKVQIKKADFKFSRREVDALTKTAFKLFDRKLISPTDYLTILRKNGTKSF